MSVLNTIAFIINGDDSKYDYEHLANKPTPDVSLSQSGVPADAKAVGDALENLGGNMIDAEDDGTTLTLNGLDIEPYMIPNGGITTPKIADGSISEVKLDPAIKTFTQAGTRANIESGDSFPTIFGKIKKWIADLENGRLTANKVTKTGDTMTGNLTVSQDSAASQVGVTSGTAASGDMRADTSGNFGMYDDKNNKWVIKSNSDGTTRLPFNVVMLNSTPVRCTQVGTSFEYTSLPALADWNVVGIRFTVHQNVHTIYAVRGISYDIGFTDTPASGYFRGTIFVDWANNRIGMRCINAGNGDAYYNLVFFDYVFGIM